MGALFFAQQPGMAAHAEKMAKLVEDLRRQESGYLGILLKLLVSVIKYTYRNLLYNIIQVFNWIGVSWLQVGGSAYFAKFFFQPCILRRNNETLVYV